MSRGDYHGYRLELFRWSFRIQWGVVRNLRKQWGCLRNLRKRRCVAIAPTYGNTPPTCGTSGNGGRRFYEFANE